MDKQIVDFIDHLKNQNRKSPNTIDAYRRDCVDFCNYIKQKGLTSYEQVTDADIVAYILRMRSEGKAGATINRRMAAIRAFGQYLFDQKVITENMTNYVKSPKAERKEIDYLTIEEVDSILNAVPETTKGIRDRALLEVIYATGIRATEVTELTLDSVNLTIGYITCSGEHGKARIVPLGRPSMEALERYLSQGRPKLLESRKENFIIEKQAKKPTSKLKVKSDFEKQTDREYLFVNYAGEKLSRQGLWKIVKYYAEKAGIETTVTPQILRNSFAIHMIQNGADLKSIQELMGYEDISATQIYLNATKKRIKEVYDKSHPRA